MFIHLTSKGYAVETLGCAFTEFNASRFAAPLPPAPKPQVNSITPTPPLTLPLALIPISPSLPRYGALLLIDSEGEYSADERAKLYADVVHLGLSLVVLADWYV